jgi:predicted RNA binding protein YcfA (HicA-like mRNA interferase family)
VLSALQRLGFELIREGNHIALARTNEKLIKGSTLRLILRQTEISREQFLEVYEEC